MDYIIEPFTPHGDITPPSSKSYTHRYLIAAFIYGKKVKITNVNFSEDVLSTLHALEKLGGVFEVDDNSITFIKRKSCGENVEINVGASASTLRMLLPLASCLANKVKFIGTPKLFSRPLNVYIDIFEKQNIKYKIGDNYIEFERKFAQIDYKIDASQSSQFCSGILFFYALTKAKNKLNINGLVSKDYVNITLEVLSTFGYVFVDYSLATIVDVNINEIRVERDYSAASNFFVLSSIKGEIKIKDLNPISTQGDKRITSLLENIGSKISYSKNSYNIKSNTLHPFEFSIKDNIDLGPILIILASLINGVSIIHDYKNLFIKESDRLNNIIKQLSPLGISFEISDVLKIHGNSIINCDKYTFDSCNDHRLAMAFTIFAISSGIRATIKNAKCITKSYPNFFKDLEGLR